MTFDNGNPRKDALESAYVGKAARWIEAPGPFRDDFDARIVSNAGCLI